MPTETSTQSAELPSWAKPYVPDLLKSAATIAQQPYQPYGGQRFAGLNPLEQRAYSGMWDLGPSSQLSTATQYATEAGKGIGPYATMQYSPNIVDTPTIRQYQMNQPQQVTSDPFNTQAMQQYMSPYMQGVVGQQKQAAIQDYARSIPGMGASAARVGGLGGTRNALVQAEGQRNLGNQLAGIQAAGSQQAFQNAQQQFGADRAAAMQAALANQQAGLTTGQQNLSALLNTQQLGAQTGLQAALANQNASLQAQQMLEQSRQFGANLGLQGLQQRLGAAQVLGGLGGQQFDQQLRAAQAQQAGGTQMRGLDQQRLDAMYQDWLAQQQYPQQQANFMANIIRGGSPTSQTTSTSTYTPPPSLGQTLTGIGAIIGSSYLADKGSDWIKKIFG